MFVIIVEMAKTQQILLKLLYIFNHISINSNKFHRSSKFHIYLAG